MDDDRRVGTVDAEGGPVAVFLAAAGFFVAAGAGLSEVGGRVVERNSGLVMRVLPECEHALSARRPLGLRVALGLLVLLPQAIHTLGESVDVVPGWQQSDIVDVVLVRFERDF